MQEGLLHDYLFSIMAKRELMFPMCSVGVLTPPYNPNPNPNPGHNRKRTYDPSASTGQDPISPGTGRVSVKRKHDPIVMGC